MIWFIGIAATLAAAWIIARPLLGAAADQGTGADDPDLQVYKAQMRELDSDLARGIINQDDAETTRLEIARRILAADKRAGAQRRDPSVHAHGLTAGFIFVICLVGVLGIYAQLGRADLPDRPLALRLSEAQALRAQRPSQEVIEAQVVKSQIDADPDYLALVEKLRGAATERPEDLQGQRLLALHEARLGNYSAARVAQQQVLALLGSGATAQDYSDAAEYMIMATNGYVSPQAEEMLGQVLRLDSVDGRARYYSGLAMAQNGRPDVGYRLWLGLLNEGPADAPWIAPIQARIADMARAAGVAPPTAEMPGPSAADIEAAGQMSAEDRQEMVRGMVGGLAARLASQGGSVDEWARLIRALGVLGETTRANEIWQEAQDVFAEDTQALAKLLAAAQSAEVAR
ncbi:c-type cytochrome biogenesis protein CcmI [Amylibacter marinus]|uniref:C-type cytochrome biogenesis protein CcmI n=1 Tax=Amylibacter marinus TaxID=1475483 RepID=A0ABQ5VUR0_9RHOB|nr:c-type cytochrome biogenesis protein CcmI [Amylibacter marinus]GLQ34828.1 c-type cytochrome biogenesis protein CcmI [Amylibacter marinus]